MRPILLDSNPPFNKYYGTTSNKSVNRSPKGGLDISNSINSHDNFETDRSFTDEDHTPWE